MNRSTPGLPVHHQLPEFTQIHVHRVGDAIQPSHPLSSPSPPAPNPSQHQGLFQCCYLSHVAGREGTEMRNLIAAQQAADHQHQGCTRPPPVSPEQPRWPNLEEHHTRSRMYLSLSLGNHCFTKHFFFPPIPSLPTKAEGIISPALQMTAGTERQAVCVRISN